MSKPNDEQWLDDELRRVVGGGRLRFDAEAWKREHAGAYATLTSRSRGRRRSDVRTRHSVRLVAGTLAAAAVIAISVATLWQPRPPEHGAEPTDDTPMRAASPASVVSMMALRQAYQQGGQEALDRQLDTALDTLGPRPDNSLLADLFDDLRG